MADILIDRELLQRLLKEHLELEVEARGFRALRNRFGIGNAGPALVYAKAHQEASERERVGIQGTYLALRKALADEDDTLALSLLSVLFPPRR